MKIALLHYHLKPGGVTTVLRHQIRALRNDVDLLMISGEEPPPDFPCSVAWVKGLGYSSPGQPTPNPFQIVDRILKSIRHHFGGPCDILHIHNPLLAKNHSFLEIIRLLQETGLILFLQVHDFAEDGRPKANFRNAAYPADCHYGVINTRDYRYLVQAGLSAEGLHYLPNCVTPLETSPNAKPNQNTLYPVRAIRRKNIGEALLLSLYLSPERSIDITQPPNSPADFQSYEDWKDIAKGYRLPVRFEVGRQRRYAELVTAAESMLTTSITEGFGFAFLEPWTAGKGLKGRLLPDICQDFSNAGISLEHLYQGIRLPKEWLGGQRLLKRFAGCIDFNRRAFGMLWPEDWRARCLNSIQSSRTVDFGMLDEPLQKKCLAMVHQNARRRQEVLARNPSLKTMFADGPSEAVIRQNRLRILSVYHPDQYRQKLIATYDSILKKPIQHAIDRRILLAAFLKIENFSLLKWSNYHA